VMAPGDSFLDFMLVETERLHAKVRRYTAPEEHAFFPDRIPPPVLPVEDQPCLLYPANVNLNQRIKQLYRNKVQPAVCQAGDDRQYGSSVVADVNALQAISKRVHYGMFVAEAKFQAEREEYTRLIRAGDEAGMMRLLTNEAVEARVISRVRRKACTFGQDIVDVAGASANGSAAAPGADTSMKLNPDAIAELYRDFIIPLTKEAEIMYLLQRLGNVKVAYHGHPGSCCQQLAVQQCGHTQGAAASSQSSAASATSDCVVQCIDAAGVAAAIMSNQAYYGLVVLEDGSGIHPGTRALLIDSPLKVVGELTLSAAYRLVSRCPLEKVRRVYGRPEALRLCRSWLLQHLVASTEQTQVEGEAGLPPWTSRVDEPEAAYLVEQFHAPPGGFGVVVEVGDAARSLTRCVVLCKRSSIGAPTGNDKTLALFAVENEPGRLAESLAIFNRHSVNLTYIQSCASGERCSEDLFYAEFTGHASDASVSAVLEELSRVARFVKDLGSFPDPSHRASPPCA